MKIYTSYFYKIRFFEPYMIPISTAVWDPSWFHKEKNNCFVSKDKRGVYNGFRYEPFVPNKDCKNLCSGITYCLNRYGINDFKHCEYFKRYREQINRLDINVVMDHCKYLLDTLKENNNFDHEPVIVFMFYEPPLNPCSERRIIQEYFKNNGINVEELDI